MTIESFSPAAWTPGETRRAALCVEHGSPGVVGCERNPARDDVH